MKLTQFLFIAIPTVCIVIPPIHMPLLYEYHPYSSGISNVLGSSTAEATSHNLQEEAHVLNHSQIALEQQIITKAGGNFIVPAKFSSLHVWVHNQGSSTLTVQVKNMSSGTDYIFHQIPAGQKLTIPNQAAAIIPGEYAIYFSGADGTVAGEFAVTMDHSIR